MATEQQVRIPAVDYLKAVSIVGVVLMHAGRPFWDPRHGAEDFWISGFLPQFAVPAFFFASGFLYQRTRPISGADVSRRLRRVLFPYLVASAAIMSLGWSQATMSQAIVESIAPSLGEASIALRAATAAVQIATGSALGIYYFVFLIVLLIPTIFVLSRLSRPVLLWALGLLALVPLVVDASIALGLLGFERTGLDLFWAARHPLGGSFQMFLFGWVGAAFLPQVIRWIECRRFLVHLFTVLTASLYAAALSLLDPWTPNLTLRLLFALSVIALVFSVARDRSPGPLVKVLSESSFAIYLYHYLFILLAMPWVDSLPSGLRLLSLALFALAGSLLLIGAGRLVLGDRARTWLGA